uniref:Uncharacterized protein n=1 Tax=Setaria digitata TaxID=48799 RepID=A0A915PY89_9BILA
MGTTCPIGTTIHPVLLVQQKISSEASVHSFNRYYKKKSDDASHRGFRIIPGECFTPFYLSRPLFYYAVAIGIKKHDRLIDTEG